MIARTAGDHVVPAPPPDAECQSCGSARLVSFYEVREIPTQTTVLLDTEQEAKDYPTGEILLALCASCGFIQNVRFDPGLVDYSIPTEESQAFSPTFGEFASDLADELMARYRLSGRTVLEIGCGKGDFMALLAERGIRYGLGMDPGFLPNRPERTQAHLEFVREWYGAESTALTADLVITRHLMEHVPNVSEFFGWLRKSVSGTSNAAMFTEVPDVERVLAEAAFWDVYYEHCSYFTEGSLRRALESAGFSVDWLEPGFGGQYLLAGAGPAKRVAHAMSDAESSEMARLVQRFVAGSTTSIGDWRSRIGSVRDGGGEVAVWGGGSKAVAFLAAVGIGEVTVVDINPYKQSKWLPAVAIEVEPPEVLLDRRPELVIPMNRAYTDEIIRDLDSMGLAPKVLPL